MGQSNESIERKADAFESRPPELIPHQTRTRIRGPQALRSMPRIDARLPLRRAYPRRLVRGHPGRPPRCGYLGSRTGRLRGRPPRPKRNRTRQALERATPDREGQGPTALESRAIRALNRRRRSGPAFQGGLADSRLGDLGTAIERFRTNLVAGSPPRAWRPRGPRSRSQQAHSTVVRQLARWRIGRALAELGRFHRSKPQRPRRLGRQ